jgi:dihydrofolate reductase
MPKYVASRTVSGPREWNGTVIAGDAADGVAKLKAELDGDLFLVGYGELAGHLLAHGLVDEIWIHPTLWGKAARVRSRARPSACSSSTRPRSTRASRAFGTRRCLPNVVASSV